MSRIASSSSKIAYKFKRQHTALAAALIAILVTSVSYGQAASTTGWTKPIQISGDVPGSESPVVAADSDGGLYFLWVSTTAPREEFPEFLSHAIYYVQYRMGQWSRPFDAIVSPASYSAYSAAEQPTAAIDSNGYLHVAWAIPNRAVYYSRSHVDRAANPANWQESYLLSDTAQDPFIIIGPDESVHVFYLYVPLDGGAGLYHISSDDHGETWSIPTPVADFGLLQQVPPRLSLTIMAAFDRIGGLHVVWSYGGAVYYAQSKDNGQTWSSPITVDQQDVARDGTLLAPTLISIGIEGEGGIHLIWDAGHNRRSCARYGRQSRDGGQTWTANQEILKPMEGCLGWNNMATDSAGVLHLVGIARDARGIVRFWQSEWTPTGWSAPQPILNIAIDDRLWKATGPDRSRLFVSEGNRLNLVWFTNDGTIQYATSQTSALQVKSSIPTLPAEAAAETPPHPSDGTEGAVTPVAKPLDRAPQLAQSTPPANSQTEIVPLVAAILSAIGTVVILTLIAGRASFFRKVR